MKVGIGKLRYLPAAWALAARVAVGAVLAVDVLRIRDGQRQRAVTFVPEQHLRVADAVLFDGANQVPFDVVLSYDVSESHT